MNLRRYVIRRILLVVPVLIGLTVITFTITHVLTNPVSAYTSDKTTPAQLQQIIQAYGFNKPLPVQYFIYLGNLLVGNWGISRSLDGEPVVSVIRQLFPATAELSVVALIIEIGLGIPLGVLAATKRDKWVDQITRILALAGVSMPVFWLGLILQYVFSFQFHVWGLPYLPATGRIDELVLEAHPLTQLTGFYIFDSFVTLNFPVFFNALAHIILPAISLAFTGLGLIVRIMRSSMLEVLRQDYIILARAKGVPQRVVVYRHALKNAIIPSLTIIGISVGYTLAGAPLTEVVFSWPGVGRWAALAIESLDINGIMGFTILVGIIFVTTNLIVDLAYAYANPRIRLG